MLILGALLVAVGCLALLLLTEGASIPVNKKTVSHKQILHFWRDKRQFICLVVAFSTAALLLIFKYNKADTIRLLSDIILNSFLIYIAYYDIKFKKITNRMVMMIFTLWLVHLFVGEIMYPGGILEELLLSLGGILFTSIIFIPAYYLSKKAIGGGDIKLFLVLSLYFKYSSIVPLILVSLFMCSLIGIIMMLMHKAQRKSILPFAPFIYFGSLMVILF